MFAAVRIMITLCHWVRQQSWPALGGQYKGLPLRPASQASSSLSPLQPTVCSFGGDELFSRESPSRAVPRPGSISGFATLCFAGTWAGYFPCLNSDFSSVKQGKKCVPTLRNCNRESMSYYAPWVDCLLYVDPLIY